MADKMYGITTYGYVAELNANTAKEQKIRAFRREVSRKAAVANKRVDRLLKNNLEDSPAFQSYLKSGGGKFSVRGKSYNEVQSELARINNLLNAETSTIRGVNRTLKEMAKNTGIKYSSLTELRAKSSQFFELASKVEQYLRNVEDVASAIGYQKIWEAISQYTKQEKIDLGNTINDVDGMVEGITKAISEYSKPVKGRFGNDKWYYLKD